MHLPVQYGNWPGSTTGCGCGPSTAPGSGLSHYSGGPGHADEDLDWAVSVDSTTVQTRPELRGRVRQVAREELGLEQLHLAARGGAGLEEFYARLGWRESGRRPGVLRFGPGDDRDEVLMHLAPL
ncbi:hypothetical protein OH717_17725 [Streptomyces albidoflavus]|nr:hypothetical protein OH717_17725 [Streptomyces albidoflavus]